MTRTSIAHGPRSVVLAVAALAAGAFAAGVADELFAQQSAPGPLARDEEFVVRFRGPAPLFLLQVGNLRVMSPGTAAPDARGTWFAGHALVDARNGRAVVVRPEAVREFFVLGEHLSRADADEKANRLLAKVERTGNLKPLDEVDAGLRTLTGPPSGSRIDDPAVTAFYPPTGGSVGSSLEYRDMIGGDDTLWTSYLVNGDINAFSQLAAEPFFERFHHDTDLDAGTRNDRSVLARRVHRRVLMRRAPNLVTFVPAVPNLADLSDAGYDAGVEYRVAAGPAVRTKVKDALPARGGVMKFVKGLATFTTAADTGDGGVFLGGTPWTGKPAAGAPRVVNVTPPSGERFLDVTTDWEDPDNQFTVPIPQRKRLVVRLRFDRPLDPRTVDAAHFSLIKTGVILGDGNVNPVNAPVAATVQLVQFREGEVRVEIRPTSILDPSGVYEARVLGSTRGLDGAMMGADFVTGFRAGP